MALKFIFFKLTTEFHTFQILNGQTNFINKYNILLSHLLFPQI